ncbi:hypothetical protein [Variovorax sp.]|jgi:hypothetical protein|uniref:hypothetical protein n=1 Tax=Variovorax sp. TaxID=1871043 RepID=UPI0037D9CA4C
MASKTAGVSVKYIGREDPFYDRLYGSNLSFKPEQVRPINDLDLVAKFLRHSDCFERVVIAPATPAPVVVPTPAAPDAQGGESAAGAGDAGEGSDDGTAEGAAPDGAGGQADGAPAGDTQPADDGTHEPEDDTDAVLAEAKKAEEARKLADQTRLDLVQTLDSMDKDQLQDWGFDKFQQKVPKTLTPENMRARLVEMIDQYGVP